jgi:hypothetical protein
MAVINRKTLTIDANVKFHVDTDVAYDALTVVKIWLNEDSDRKLEAEQLDDGTWILHLFEGKQ